MLKKKFCYLLIMIPLFLGCSKESTYPDLQLNEIYELKDIKADKKLLDDDLSFFLKFDFSKEYERAYEYRNKANQTSYNSMMDDVSEQDSESSGQLILKSSGNNEAELIYKDILSTIHFNFGIDNKKQENVSGPDTIYRQGLQEDGTNSVDKTVEFRTRMVFPITGQEFKQGIENIFEISLPINLYGSSLILKGNLTILCEDFYKIDNRICAKLVTSFVIDDANLPDDIKKSNKVIFIGNGIYYFDIKKFEFIYGDVIISTKMKSETEFPKTNDDFPKPEKEGVLTQDIKSMEEILYQRIK